MTPLSLNPPGPSMQGQNHPLFNNIPPNNQDSTTSFLSCNTFFNMLDRRAQTMEVGELRVKDQEDDKQVLHDGSSSNIHQEEDCNSCLISPQSAVTHDPSNAHKIMEGEEEEGKNCHGSAKWMSSKMRLMKKMMRPSSSSPSSTDNKAINTSTTTTPSSRIFQNQGYENRHSQRSPRNYNTNTITRVCSDCNTSSTPLWRSGPKGPKSLCNACGIRQRKARRAMAEAANGLATPTDAPFTKNKVHKEKKTRINHFAQFKNKCKSTTTTSATASSSSSQGAMKLEQFKDFAMGLRNNSAGFEQVFPRDEVAEAALLLMDLSCGYVQL